MDPLSIAAGVGALIELCVNAGSGIKKAHDGAKSINSKMGLLDREIRGYVQVLEAMSTTLQDSTIRASFQTTGHIGNHWSSILGLIEDSTDTLERLNAILRRVGRSARILSSTRKHFRLQSATEEINAYKNTIKIYRDVMQMSMQTIILWNQVSERSSQANITLGLDDLTQVIRNLGTDMNTQIASLRALVQVDSVRERSRALRRMRRCVETAADVVSSASTTLGLDDRATVIAPSELGDIFGPRNHQTVIQWLDNGMSDCESVAGPIQDQELNPGASDSITGGRKGGLDRVQLAIQSSCQIDPSVPLTDLIISLGFSPHENTSSLPASLTQALRNRFSNSYLAASLRLAISSPRPLNTLPYFVLGSFIFPSVVSSVVGDLAKEEVAKCMTPARIKGYKRCSVKHATFPAAFPSTEAGEEIQGMVLFGMDTPERRSRMGRFQGGMYDLQRGIAEIVSSEGVVFKQEVVLYVWNGPSWGLDMPGDGGKNWSASRMMRGGWLRGNLQLNGEFVPDCPGWEEEDRLEKEGTERDEKEEEKRRGMEESERAERAVGAERAVDGFAKQMDGKGV